jgi:nitroreductase
MADRVEEQITGFGTIDSTKFSTSSTKSEVEENMDKVLDSWQELGYMKPEMREVSKGMAQNLYGTVDSLKRKLFAVKNTALFAMNLMIAAKGLGLETHPMDGFDEDSVKKEFGIPEDNVIPMLVAVGNLKDGVKLLPRAFRRPINEFVSFV